MAVRGSGRRGLQTDSSAGGRLPACTAAHSVLSDGTFLPARHARLFRGDGGAEVPTCAPPTAYSPCAIPLSNLTFSACAALKELAGGAEIFLLPLLYSAGAISAAQSVPAEKKGPFLLLTLSDNQFNDVLLL